MKYIIMLLMLGVAAIPTWAGAADNIAHWTHFLSSIPGALFGSIAVLALAGAVFYAIYRGVKFGKGDIQGQIGGDGKLIEGKAKPLTLVERLEQLHNEMANFSKNTIELNEANSTFHFMDKENQENDDRLKQKCRDRVNSMRNRIQNDLILKISDRLVVSAVCRTMRMIFQSAIIRNHFTKELMRPKISAYRSRILDEMRQEYLSLHLTDDRIPPLETVDSLLISFVDEWLKSMKEEVAVCCEEKISVYKQYLPKLDRVQYFKEIVEECIQKNENYMRQLAD